MRRGAWAITAIVVLAGLSLWVVTRSWFIVAQLRPGLERALGGEVLIGRAAYAGDGRFVIENFSLRSRSHEGVPGEIAFIGRAVIHTDMSTIWSGDPLIHEVVLHDVLLRVSEDAHEAGAFSFLGLDPIWEQRDDRTPVLPPRIEVRRATVAYGRHDGHRFELRGSRTLTGEMLPIAEDTESPWYSVFLNEIGAAGEASGGIVIRGRWNALTFEHESLIEGLDLDERTHAMCPEAVRVWLDRMDLAGRVASASVEWRAQGDFDVTMEVENVGLTLPIDTDDLLVRYEGGRIVGPSGRQRMNVHSGTIRLNNERLELDDLRGELAGEASETARVPYALKLTIGGFSELTWAERDRWMDEVVASAPFELHLDVQNFHVTDTQSTRQDVKTSTVDVEHTPGRGLSAQRSSERGGVDLPVPIAHMLEAASITDWTLSMRMRAGRAPGSDRLETSGRALISGGAGAYDKFSYRLTGVQAAVHFTNDRAVIEFLTGVGPSGAAVRLSGEIAPLGRHPGLNLKLNAENVPLDEHLRRALNERQQGLFDSLVHVPSYELLHDAGLLPDEPAIEAMRVERRDIARRIAGLRDAENGHDEQALLELLLLTRREAQLDAVISAGPFEIDSSSGSVRLDMRIQREAGPDMPTRLTGTTIMHSARVLVEQFPYPITITGGSLIWEIDRVSIVAGEESRGLHFTAPGGGRGVITGHIERAPRGHSAGFDLQIEAVNDAINDLVYAAIPLTGDEELDAAAFWPGGVLSNPAVLLRSVGLEGPLEYSGRVWRETSRDDVSTEPALAAATSHVSTGNRNSRHGDQATLGTQNADLSGIDYRFTVSMMEGRARPTSELEHLISAIGLLWPEGLEIDRVRGEVIVTPEHIELVTLSGAHADGRLIAAGALDLAAHPVTSELDVLFGDLTLGRYLIDLMPSESAKLARELWERYEPGGRFNAHLSYRARGGEAEPVRLAVEPLVTHVRIGDDVISLHLVTEDKSTSQQNDQAGSDEALQGSPGSAAQQAHDSSGRPPRDRSEPSSLRSPGPTFSIAPRTQHFVSSGGGRITLDSGQVRFEDLALRMMRGDRDDGEIALSGSYGMVKGDETLDARGSWVGGQFDSPLIVEVLGLIGAADHAERYRSLHPFGEFDASFSYAAPRNGGKTQYEFTVSPRVIGFQSEGEQATAEMSPASRIVLTPGLVELEEVAGTHGGNSFVVTGRVRIDGPPDASLRISHRGELQSPLVRAALPPGVREVLDGLRFDDGHGTVIDDALLRLAQARPGGPWRAQFQGEVRMNSSSLLAGVPLEEIDGDFTVFVQHEPGSPLALQVGGEVSRMKALDQELTGVSIDSIRLDESGTTVLIPMLRGESHGGAVWAKAEVGVGENREYDATIELVSVSLAGLATDSAAPGDDDRRNRSRLPQAKLYGSLRIAGLRDAPHSRTGRGNVRAMGGSVFGIPLALQIMNILQFIAPLRTDLDHADADFFIDGERLVFERILFESTVGGGLALQLIGEGEMNLKTQEIRTQFRSRSGMLVLRDLAGGLGDQLYQIEVHGTLRNPKARIVPLPGLAPPRAATSQEVNISASPAN